MKIYTITCHDVYNVGASLQAYALATYLKDQGHQVEIIDYKPEYLNRHYRLTVIGNSKYDRPILRELYLLAKFPRRWKALHSRRKAEFDRFKAKMLPVTNRRYTSNEDLKVNLPKADVYFAGSDQIWNCFFQNGRDPAFYLDFAPENSVKASYAASFATEDIQEEWKTKVKKWISGLDAISVRESSGVEIVKCMGIESAVQVLDPVFLLDDSQWSAIEKQVVGTEKYLLLYDFDKNPELLAFSKSIAQKNGWKVYSVLYRENCDRCFDQEGPQAFINLIHHAEFVVSNSFHATAFSIIFERPFAVFNRTEKINTRMRDLVFELGVDDRIALDANWNPTQMDYTQVRKRLQTAIEFSKSYISNVTKRSKEKSEDL